LQAFNELIGIPGLAQRLIIGDLIGGEVRRQILVGITVAIGAFDPDLLATQALTEHLQCADLVVDTVDALAIGSILHQDLLQLGADDPVDGDLGTGDQLAAILPVRFDPVQCIDHRAMGAVVGAEHQGYEDQRQHAPIVMTVGAVNQGLYPMAKGRAAHLALPDQRRQGGFPHQRKEHLAYYPLWIVERGLGDAEQQAGLTFDALPFADHLGGDTLLGLD
jgi:hypothetical protein